jgi:hypothetical protein
VVLVVAAVEVPVDGSRGVELLVATVAVLVVGSAGVGVLVVGSIGVVAVVVATHGPPGGPEYPSSHVQCVTNSLPTKEVECEGHAVQPPESA